MRPTGALALAGIAVTLSACGATPSDQVRAKLTQFTHAVAQRDAATLCRQVLAPSLLAHLAAAGLDCRSAMRTFVAGVSHPTLAVQSVRVTGSTATAVVRTGARGQPSSTDKVALVDTGQGWRLTTLASPR